MCMGKQMLLTIFVISIAFGAESEFQIISVFLCPATNGTFMGSDTLFAIFLTPHLSLPAMDFLGRIAMQTPHTKEKENKIPQGKKSHQAISRMYDDSNLHQCNNHIDC